MCSVPKDAHQLAGVPLPHDTERARTELDRWDSISAHAATLLYIAQRGGFRVGGFNRNQHRPNKRGATNIDSFKPEIARDHRARYQIRGRLGSFRCALTADVYEEE